ncbi:MAG: hypothetical protein GF317_07280 [Candidatus Lokiarchaeota archaeon]|nr:hypothetical protein [Candidatus Lokiarchaeota archaeon]MBD3199510.1 hypothetical protein [Candidatus Lokiarchaeota archaeon]
MNSKVARVYDKLKEIFLSIDSSFFKLPDSEFLNSNEADLVFQMFPEYYRIIRKSFDIDEEEAIRTLKHTFKTLQVYFLILSDNFESNLTNDKFGCIREELKEIADLNPIIFPLILLLHDIGRPFNRTWHTIESKNMIYHNSLLDGFDLEELEKIIVLIVIEHHLLIGTIFTGESSYLGSISLWKSIAELEHSLSGESIDIIFQCLSVFTIIDIWGYDYSTIYDHYFDYYTNIRLNLAQIFKEVNYRKDLSGMKILEEKLAQLDHQNLKWRIACSLRIFQFIDTKPYLTKRFYFRKIEEGLEQLGMNWKQFESRLGNYCSRIQFKYTLGIMMILAMNEFKRNPIDKSFKIESNIFNFWIECSKIIYMFLKRNEQQKSPLFYYVFDLPRTWFLQDYYRERIKKPLLIEKIKKSNFDYNHEIFGYINKIKIK